MSSFEESWRITHKTLASCVIAGNDVRVTNVRDFKYPNGSEDAPEQRFLNMTFSTNSIMNAWISIIPFRPHFAHLITSFGLCDGRYIAISIEIRYRVGEPYILWKTFVPHYWLSYVVATEDDVFRVRTNVRNGESLHLYKLTLTPEEASCMCVGMLTRAEKVNNRTPERFNSVWNSCTSNVLSHLKYATNHPLPYSRAQYLTDRLDPYLAKQGLLDIDAPYTSDVRAAHCINNIARNIPVDTSDFSKRIRSAIGY